MFSCLLFKSVKLSITTQCNSHSGQLLTLLRSVVCPVYTLPSVSCLPGEAGRAGTAHPGSWVKTPGLCQGKRPALRQKGTWLKITGVWTQPRPSPVPEDQVRMGGSARRSSQLRPGGQNPHMDPSSGSLLLITASDPQGPNTCMSCLNQTL